MLLTISRPIKAQAGGIFYGRAVALNAQARRCVVRNVITGAHERTRMGSKRIARGAGHDAAGGVSGLQEIGARAFSPFRAGDLFEWVTPGVARGYLYASPSGFGMVAITQSLPAIRFPSRRAWE